MDSGIPFRLLKDFRCETDLYGYAEWLSAHLGVPNKRPFCHFQHMWIWWDLIPEDVCWALDPNLFSSVAAITQDEHIAKVIQGLGHRAVAGGLPFLSFVENHPIDARRNGRTLYVSTHSTAWRDVSSHTIQAAREFTKDNDVTVLLSHKDRHLAEQLGVPCLLGADTLDANSFYRIQKIFSEFEYMITDRMGSHVLYGLACGMKVGLSARHNIDAVFSEVAIQRGLVERARSTRDLKFLDDRFPGLVIEGGRPTYTQLPEIFMLPAEDLAKLIWL